MRSPILFLVFNRPESTQQVFDAIRKARPPKLYLAADGPRKNKAGEAVRCQVVQEIISNVDWPCEVSRLIRKKNLGCKIAVSSAIDWFFSCESEGIILEDDCLPHNDFFTYCDELLEKYRHDERIGLISGTAYGDLREQKLISGSEDFIFNRYPSIWGWASWRRVWKDYDVKIKKWENYRQDISPLTVNLKLRKKNDWLFDQVSNSKIDTWDYQVSFLLWSTARLAITPRFNLIENIGFGADATHTKQSYQIDASRIKMSRERLNFPLIEPKIFSPNYVYQVWVERYATRSILIKLMNRIKNYAIK
ncbi:hypothetical protein [Polynucleobacter asymbioticus]|jgi:hypothetical protein|uniref:hypothetical protein n=1 Tax=Polynucleobacter asymbioticus TaxID=576611 RepID=UPI0008F8CBA2|nr:hypothetical protein [Polynucleobacter asymbioticus]